MALLNETFDATTVEPASFDVLPAGKYKVHVVESEMRPTSNGDGQYLWMRLDVVDGEFHGRPLFDRIMLNHPNQQTVEIARRKLSALCHACGKLAVSDSEELHFLPVIANVTVRQPRVDKNTGKEYDASNEIRGYSSADGSAPQQPRPGRPAQAAAAASSAASAVPPWKQHKTA